MYQEDQVKKKIHKNNAFSLILFLFYLPKRTVRVCIIIRAIVMYHKQEEVPWDL